MSLLLTALIKSMLVLAGTLLVARLLRHQSAAARHLVWTCGLLAALALPAAALLLPRWEVPVITLDRTAPAPIQVSGNDDSRSAAMARRLENPAAVADTTSSEETTAAASPSISVFNLSWPAVALAAWAAGVIALLGRLLAGILAVRIMARRTKRTDDASWVPLAKGLARDLGVANVEFRRGETGTMPVAWGILRPVVLMPADADSWPEDRLRVVLLHELAHVKRADCLTHILAQAACAVHWINPLAWTAVRQARIERERACDDLVLACGMSDVHYANQLLEIARAMRTSRFSAAMAGASLAMAHRSQLEGRLMAILDRSVPRTPISRARSAAAGVFAFAVLVPFASVQPWAYAVVPKVPAKPRPAVTAQAPAPVRQTVSQPSAPRTVSETVPTQLPRSAGLTEAVVGGIVGAVAGGALEAIVEAVPAAVADALEQAAGRPNPNPNPNPNPENEKQARVTDPKIIAALMTALKDSDTEVRETAMQALVQLRAPNMFEPLVDALKDASADIRERAAFGLGQLDDKRAIAPLTAALKDSSASVREQAVFALGQLRDPAVTDALVIALKDESPSVREQAAFALGQIGNKAAVDALMAALRDASANVRQQAVFALGQLGDARALDALTAALKDADADVRQQAAFAIGQLAR